MKLYLLLFLLLSVSFCYSKGGINKVVSSLADYQIPGSGFSQRGDVPTLEATSNAIFLSSFFGQRSKIDVAGVSEFLKSVTTDDGYSNTAGDKTDLNSVRNALLTLNNLGLPGSSTDLKSFVLSLYDQDKNLFSNTFGGIADLRSTAIALQCLEQLNSLDKASLNKIKSTLESFTKTQGSVKFFSGDLVENAYGIIAGSLVGFDFGDVAPWTRFFTDKQARSGEFKGAFLNNEVASIEATESAVTALAILQGDDLSSVLNTENLLDYLDSLPKELDVASSAFRTIARAGLLEEILKTRVVYETLQDTYSVVTDKITQGLQMKPKISVRTPSGLAHDGLDVSVSITDSKGETKTIRLPWDAESQYYVGNSFYAAETLGEATFTFNIKWLVADLNGELEYSIVQHKTVGYKVRVTPKAEIAGKTVPEGGDIGIGTEFDFALSLETIRERNLLSGDFVVDFIVKDSSGEAISQESLDCRENDKPIKFSYVLEQLNIPAGNVVFSFLVKSSGSSEYHTVRELEYSLVMKMIATQIEFPKTEFKLGDTFEVSMSPASFPDLSKVIPLTSKSGNTLRRFVLDVVSSGTVVNSVEGVASVGTSGELRYTFSVAIAPTFDSLGRHTVLFKYVPAYGQPQYLENYDSEAEDLFTEGQELSFSVDSVARIDDISGSLKADLKYGNNIQFSFRVQDQVSKKYIFPESPEYTVYLRLKHQDENGAYFIGSTQPSTVVYKDNVPQYFSFDWTVNPNVVKGKGELELIVQTPNGPIPLLGKDNKDWKMVVNIGGDVEVASTTHSGEIDEFKTVFTVQLTITCDNVRLNDADLVAVVSRDGNDILVAPVSRGAESGNYELSWNMRNKETESGTYTVNFYRAVDVERTDDLSQVEPFFTTNVEHEKKIQERGIIPTQFLALVLLVSAFGYMSYRKLQIENPKRK